MGRDGVRSQEEAWLAYDRWLEDERVTFLNEPADLEPKFRDLSRLRSPAAKDWADSYLAAFAFASRLTLVTFDRGFERKTSNLILLEG